MKKFISLALAALLLLSFSALFALAEGEIPVVDDALPLSRSYVSPLEDKILRYNSENRNIISVSNKGDFKQAPENSLDAIDKAVKKGADMVRLDVKSTKDGVLVLCADDNLLRVSPDADSRPISECDYSEIKNYRLYMGVGGQLSELSNEKLATLDQAFSIFGDSVMFMLDFSWELRTAVWEAVSSAGLQDSSVLICRAKPKEVSSWLEGLSQKPKTAIYRKTNIVFTGIAYSKAAAEIGASVFFASSNPYGFVFKPSVMKYAGKQGMRAIATTADSELCGSRNDTAEYWNDLVRRGYSVIITNNIEELSDFIANSTRAEEKLRYYYEQVKAQSLPKLKSYIYLDYQIEYNRAVAEAERVLAKRAIGEQEAYTCIYKLEKSINSIKRDYLELKNGVAGLTVSFVRIFIAVIAVAAVALVQIYFYKRRKKPVKQDKDGGIRLD